MGNGSLRTASIAEYYTPRPLYTPEYSNWIKCHVEKYQLSKLSP